MSAPRVGVAGLGYWGPNLARNFDELADLAWLCDLDPELRARFAARYPNARTTGSFEEMLADDRLVDDASLVVDLRNATGVKGTAADHVFKL